VPDLALWTARVSGLALSVPLGVHIPALALFGFAHQAAIVARNAVGAEIAPDDRRPSYIAFLNAVSLPMAFLPAPARCAIGGSMSTAVEESP
jgi:hypothetical protein